MNFRYKTASALGLMLFLFLPATLAFASSPASRILFVGNSYLYYNDSLHNHVRRLVQEMDPQLTLTYKSATIGGARLSHHALDYLLEPARLGVREPFGIVVLQGGSAEALTESGRLTFIQQVINKVNQINNYGAQAYLYLTPAYVDPHPRSHAGMLPKVQSMYEEAAQRSGAQVIPVGLAFARSYAKHPEILLHNNRDGSHPSLLGTYLAACVVVASIYGASPVGLSYDYFGRVDESVRLKLQEIARETVSDYQNYQRR
ncbi:MAG: DUF4886 domain-containing protein [Pseudomonadota bacterium]